MNLLLICVNLFICKFVVNKNDFNLLLKYILWLWRISFKLIKKNLKVIVINYRENICESIFKLC